MLVDLIVNASVIVVFGEMCLTYVLSLRKSPKVDVIFFIQKVRRSRECRWCDWLEWFGRN